MNKRTIYLEDAVDALNALFMKQIIQFDYKGYEDADDKTKLVCDGISESIGCVMNLPSAQPEIIRCKECKWFNRAGCAIEIVDTLDNPTENDFCSFAERKEE